MTSSQNNIRPKITYKRTWKLFFIPYNNICKKTKCFVIFSLQTTAVPRCLVKRLKEGPVHKSSDSNKKNKSEKNKQRIEEAEAKVKKNDLKSIKTSSGRLFGFDMFAEKVTKIQKRLPGCSSISQQLPKAALYTPLSSIIRASPAKPLSSPKPVFPDKKAANNSFIPRSSQVS